MVPNRSPNHTINKLGFTLLEVIIALAILVMALTILVDSQSTAAFMVRDADRVRMATQLAEEKMVEAQLILEFDGWTSQDIDESGDFDDFGAEDFRGTGMRSDVEVDLSEFKWAYTVRRIEFSLPSDIGGITDDLMGGGYFGDAANEQYEENENPNQMDLGDIGISPDMISEYLADYIREVRIMVWWGENEDEEDQVELLTHVINPSGVVSDDENGANQANGNGNGSNNSSNSSSSSSGRGSSKGSGGKK